MKAKLIIMAIGSGIVGSSIFIAVTQSHHRAMRQRQLQQSEERVSTVMSNYTRTFKLNTSPAIFPEQPKK